MVYKIIQAFRVAWVSFAVTKVMALVYTVYAVAVSWNDAPTAWSVLLVSTTGGITVTQVYSTLVLRKLSKRMSSQWLSSISGPQMCMSA